MFVYTNIKNFKEPSEMTVLFVNTVNSLKNN